MKIKMTLLSDAVFGSGISVPGGEDISILVDQNGFPYYKASAFKGVFREEATNILCWEGNTEKRVKEWMDSRLGKSGDRDLTEEYKIRFTDICLSDAVKEAVKEEIGDDPEQVLRVFSYLRTFTALDDNGMVKEGSLRSCRCLKQGLIFYGEIDCKKEDEALVLQAISCMKWIGTMRTRGFGRVKIERG